MLLTTPHLQEISFQVCRGNAAYGLLLANEYLAPHHPLRKALAGKAQFRLANNHELPIPLLHAILGGAVAATLNDDWRSIVGPKVMRIEKKEIPSRFTRARAPQVRGLGHRRRVAVRERLYTSKATALPYAVRAARVTSRTFESVG